MTRILVEVLVVFILLIANGLFSMAEIAIVSSKKGKLRRLASAGDKRAQTALDLAESPNRFLATVQIGITLVGIFAGAFGGATLSEKLAQAIPDVPYGKEISFSLVVAVITYFSLVIGELVPKRIGLGNPEGIAMFLARFMHRLSVFAGPLVTFLSKSTDALLRIFAVKPEKEAVVTEEEVRGLMQEGLRAGAFNRVESEIIHSALELDQVRVRDIMTPRTKITWINKHDLHEAVWHKIVVSNHSYFPVYEDNRDNVVGIVSLKSIYANLAAGTQARIKDLMIPPLIAPATLTAIQLLDVFKQKGRHIALVADEFGTIIGLVTLNDVMEAVLGEFPSQEERQKPKALKRDDGTWLVDGLLDLQHVEAAIPGMKFAREPAQDFETLGGFILHHLCRIPTEGESFQWMNHKFEVIDMDKHRVDKVLISPIVGEGT